MSDARPERAAKSTSAAKAATAAMRGQATCPCPADGELLRLLDGELPPARTEVVREHVHACWSCRARYEELKATVSAFVDVIEGTMRAGIPGPPRQWAGFQTQLRAATDAHRVAQTRAELTLSGRVRRTVASMRMVARAWRHATGTAGEALMTRASMRHVVRSTALAALVALFIAFVPASPRLSAQVILDQAMAADSRAVASVTRPVTRQRFEASRRVNGHIVERAQWELYHDVQSGRARAYAITATARASSASATPTGAEMDATSGTAAARPASDDASLPLARSARPPSVGSRATDMDTHPASSTAAALSTSRDVLPPLAAEVLRLLEAHDWDRGGPLSSAGYDRWHRSLVSASTDYTALTLEDGRPAYRVLARMPEPVRAGAIASAGLVVRADDWHAVRQDLEVRTATGTDDIQITELAFDVLRFDRLAAGIFTEERGPAPAVAIAAPPRATTAADLDDAEMSVRYALHRLQADRGEPIQVVRGPSRVTVRGLVDSTARATELEATLGRIAGVRIDLTALDRLKTVAPRNTATDGTAAVVYADRSVDPPLQPVIDAFLATSDGDGIAMRRNAFVARTLAASDRAMADAWALRRLAERYPPDAVAEMPERSSELLEEMVRDYVRGLIVSTSAWRAELSALAPFARARLGGAANAADPARDAATLTREPWPAYGATMFRVFARAQSLTTDGLVGALPAPIREAADRGPRDNVTTTASAGDSAERQLLALLDDLMALEQTLRRLDDEARQGRRLTAASAAPAPSPR